ncbi:hypothetical protein ACFRCI_23595 [Streptomyces sp. NPDC056638]|uniref:hypothetical protein n=1 Tax=Streptomyces sp. NPDC056638 TaxID=3345887 RepID=UPI00369B8106
MRERKFLDCDGDTWTEYLPGLLRLTAVGPNTESWHVGVEESIETVRDIHGPLTEIRPDVDVRALLADLLEDLAEELRHTTDLPRVLDTTARKMREASK